VKRKHSDEPSRRKTELEGSSSADKKRAQIVKEKKFAPFNQLLKGVAFTISGFQNPLRGIIREKALGMAKILFL
jgi:hypothetical protein